MTRKLNIIVLSVLLASTGAGRGLEKTEPHIGDMHLQTLPPLHFFYGTLETDFPSVGEPLGKMLNAMYKTAGVKKVPIRGPTLHIYFNSPHRNPDKRFKMETGFPVAEGAQPVGGFKVRQTPRFKCATMVYIGPAPRIGEAWEKLIRAATKAGLTPTGEEREFVLYWEDVQSANNVFQIQMGVK